MSDVGFYFCVLHTKSQIEGQALGHQAFPSLVQVYSGTLSYSDSDSDSLEFGFASIRAVGRCRYDVGATMDCDER